MAKRLFISKLPGEIVDFQQQLEQHDWTVIAHSFLSFESVDFDPPEQFDVLFFGSPRAVIFSKAQFNLHGDFQIACVGQRTAEIAQQIGLIPDYIGEKSGNTAKNVANFHEWLGDRTVFFPQSDKSLKSFARSLPETQVHETIAYQTNIRPHQIDSCDLYVFTSPSNVEGFIQSNSFPENAQIIAWGTSTSDFLAERGYSVSKTLDKSSLEELINLLA